MVMPMSLSLYASLPVAPVALFLPYPLPLPLFILYRAACIIVRCVVHAVHTVHVMHCTLIIRRRTIDNQQTMATTDQRTEQHATARYNRSCSYREYLNSGCKEIGDTIIMIMHTCNCPPYRDNKTALNLTSRTNYFKNKKRA